jgi:hypothetical protein
MHLKQRYINSDRWSFFYSPFAGFTVVNKPHFLGCSSMWESSLGHILQLLFSVEILKFLRRESLFETKALLVSFIAFCVHKEMVM